MHLKALTELVRFHGDSSRGSFCVYYIDVVHTTNIE